MGTQQSVKKLDAYTTYLILTGADGGISSLIFTVNMIYQATVVGLDPLQLVLVGTTLEVTAFLFEVPTGIVADVYSRRLSIIIGYILVGVGFIIEGTFPVFATVLLAQVIWGVGWTLTSGATEAWLTDEIGEDKAGRAFLRASQIAQVAVLFAVVAGVFIGNVQVNLPIILGGIGFIAIGVFLAIAMPETGFRPTPRENRDSFQHMWHTFREGLAMVRRRPALTKILGIGWFHGLYSEGIDRLWTPFLLTFALPRLDGLTTVTWFGIIRVGGIALGIVANEIAHRRVKIEDEVTLRRALFAINVAMVVALVAFAVSFDFWFAMIAYWLWSALRRTFSPLHTAWVNQRLDSQVRATVISMSSQADALGQMIGGPPVGLIGNLVSLRAALAASAIILSPALALFARAKNDR